MRTEKLFESIDAAVDAGLNVSVFMVIGLPHDNDQSTSARTSRSSTVSSRRGRRDVSVSFYMALPGTELFDSLYDSRADQARSDVLLPTCCTTSRSSRCRASAII